MFVNPLSDNPWRDSTPQHHRTAECKHMYIKQSRKPACSSTAIQNTTGSIPFQLNVPQGYVLLPQKSQHDPFEIRFPI